MRGGRISLSGGKSIRSNDWVEALPSQRRLQFLPSYVFVLVSSKNFYHHQVQLNGNFRLNLSIVFVLYYLTLWYLMVNSGSRHIPPLFPDPE